MRKEHISKMKSGAILANSGHFDAEINKNDLDTLTKSKKTIRPNVDEHTLNNGRKIYLLAEGRLVNLAAAEGHPSEVMDMSFANQALSAEYITQNRGKLAAKVYTVPENIDMNVARLKLESMNVKIDSLTPEQKRYLSDWKEGT